MHNEQTHGARTPKAGADGRLTADPAGGVNTDPGANTNTGPNTRQDTEADFTDNLIPGVKAVLEQLARTPEMVSMVWF